MCSILAVPRRDCADIQSSGLTTSGVYTVYVGSNSTALTVFCDMNTTTGGWTVSETVLCPEDISKIIFVFNELCSFNSKMKMINEQKNVVSHYPIQPASRQLPWWKHSAAVMKQFSEADARSTPLSHRLKHFAPYNLHSIFRWPSTSRVR